MTLRDNSPEGASLRGSPTSAEAQTSHPNFDSNDFKASIPLFHETILKSMPDSLEERILNLFQSENSLHASQIMLHYNGIRHELNYPDHRILSEALKNLVSQNRLIKRVRYQSYKTSIFMLQLSHESSIAHYHAAVEKSISLLNHQKGKKLELLVKRVVSKISCNVVNEFKYPPKNWYHIDVYSDDFCIECKNWDRSQRVGEREVKKFLNVKSKFSSTLLTINRTFFFIASSLSDSAKKMLTDHNIKYIETGFQVISWSDRSAYKKLFNLITSNCPKTYPLLDEHTVFMSYLFYFILSGLKTHRSRDMEEWRYTLLNVPYVYRKKLLGDLG